MNSNETSGKKILFIAPSFATAGGDVHILECIKRWYAWNSFKEFHVVTTKRGVINLGKNNLKKIRTYLIPLIPEDEEYFFHRNTFSLITSHVLRMVLGITCVLKMIKKRIKPNLVIAQSHFIYDVLPAVVFSKLSKAKLAVYLHMLEPPPFKRAKYHPLFPNILTWISQTFSLTVIKYNADLVFVAPCDKVQLTKKGIKTNKIETLYYGVNLDEISKIKRVKTRYEACFMARLVPLKGIFDIAKVWKNVSQSFPNARIVIIGQGTKNYTYRLKREIEALGLKKNVIILGALYGTEKYVALKSCKVFVYPSYLESWGIVICEAMACGLPVIAYDLPAYRIFGEDTLFKVQVGNVKALSDAVIKLLSDKKLREEMGQRARALISQFNWDEIAERELKVLSNLLNVKNDLDA